MRFLTENIRKEIRTINWLLPFVKMECKTVE